MIEHSKTPWTYQQNSMHHVSIYDANGTTVAVIDITDLCDEDNEFEFMQIALANAKLIVEKINEQNQTP